MRVSKQILCVLVILASSIVCAHGQENAKSPPPKYRLELIYVSDAASREYLLVIGNIGFKSVASLKKFLADLPAGSILEWDPGCIRWGGEPLLSSREDMEDFMAFCVAIKINFIWYHLGEVWRGVRTENGRDPIKAPLPCMIPSLSLRVLRQISMVVDSNS